MILKQRAIFGSFFGIVPCYNTVLKCQTLRCLKKKLAMIYLHERALTPETQTSIYQFTTILITMA